jgi:hypothetical protein
MTENAKKERHLPFLFSIFFATMKSNASVMDIIGEKLFKEKILCSQMSNIPAL